MARALIPDGMTAHPSLRTSLVRCYFLYFPPTYLSITAGVQLVAS